MQNVPVGYSNAHKDGASLSPFPKDASLRKRWADQVRRTREKWVPTEHTLQGHFEAYCFEQVLPNNTTTVGMGGWQGLLQGTRILMIAFGQEPLYKWVMDIWVDYWRMDYWESGLLGVLYGTSESISMGRTSWSHDWTCCMFSEKPRPIIAFNPMQAKRHEH